MIYRCTPCNFKTDRQSLYARHCRTSSHLTLNFLLQSNGDETDPTVPSNDVLSTSYANLAESDSESDDETASLQNGASNDNDSYMYQNFPTSSVFDEYSEHSEDEQENNESFSRLGTAETETEWYPFSSKAECLMYVFMHSTTHPISDEVTKFVLFMLKELGVAGVPSLQRLKNFKIGTFWWKEFVTKEHYGIFKEGLILQGSSKLLVVKIHLARITEEKAVGCPKVELLERMDFFKSTSITRKMPIIHDCKGGHCRVVEELTTEKMEQEKVTTERVSLKHCLMHKKYVVNMYSL